jgi:hypothetical protein
MRSFITYTVHQIFLELSSQGQKDVQSMELAQETSGSTKC